MTGVKVQGPFGDSHGRISYEPGAPDEQSGIVLLQGRAYEHMTSIQEPYRALSLQPKSREESTDHLHGRPAECKPAYQDIMIRSCNVVHVLP